MNEWTETENSSEEMIRSCQTEVRAEPPGRAGF